MRYRSTRGESPAADLETALFEGLAPDGGLYVPELPEPLGGSFFESLEGASLAEIGTAVLAPFVSELSAEELGGLLAAALPFDTPLTPLEDGIHLLELFHGPTFAFKDVGARFTARLLARFLGEDPRPLTVLVATSGDTGGAVADAFHGVAGTRVAILYPRGKVSPLQESQLTTLGGNVEALAVEGTFDDCQRLAKGAFRDRGLRERVRLTSANSISIGRLLPQMLYYFRALAQLPAGAAAPAFSIPSGNFGNLTAGLLAERLGLAASRFVASTNANDGVPEYLETGLFSPRPSVATISNAMDVGDPSNLERIRWLFGDDLAALRRRLTGSRHGDEATRQAVREVFERTGRVLDPHTAVGYLGLRQALAEGRAETPGIVLSTAHPAKFREHVEPLVGPVALPEGLAACLEKPSRSVPLAAEPAALEAFLRGW